MGKKNAQISIFLAIGVALVVLVSLFFVIRGLLVNRSLEEDAASNLIIEKVDSEFKPLQTYVDACLQEITVRGIRKIGMQGGYINGEELRSNPTKPTDKDSDAINFFPKDSGQKIAYWWHMDSDEDCFSDLACSFAVERPSLEGAGGKSIESQLEGYVEDNIGECLNNGASFEDLGLVVESNDDPTVDITITEKDIVADLKYAMSASTKSGKSSKLTRFATRVDVNIRELYDLASEITKLEGENAFLEQQLINIIALHSGTDSDSLLPPFYNPMATTIDPKYAWTRTEIKSIITSLLSTYVSAFRVLESRNFEPVITDSDITRSFFDNMIISANDSRFLYYDVDFDYASWWDLYLKIGNGELIRPEGDMNDFKAFLQKVPLLGSIASGVIPDEYAFSYDVSYPVLVTIKDESALGGEGYSFRFALESNLRNNMPVYVKDGVPDFEGVSNTLYTSEFCNVENYKTGDIKITIVDEDGNQIPNAVLTYSGQTDSCIMGVTSQKDDGEIYFESKFPSCFGCYLTVDAAGYSSKSIGLSLDNDKNFEVPEIELKKIYEKKIDFKVLRNIKSASGDWAIDFTPVDIRPSEIAMINIEKVLDGDDPLEDDFSSIAYYVPGEEKPVIKLIPGEYRIEGQLLFDLGFDSDSIEKILVPSKTDEFCTGLELFGGCLGDTEEVEYPEIPFEDVFPEGSVYIDENHGGTWSITQDDLESTDTITFYIIASPYIPESSGAIYSGITYSDIDEIGKADYYSDRFSSCIRPSFRGGVSQC